MSSSIALSASMVNRVSHSSTAKLNDHTSFLESLEASSPSSPASNESIGIGFGVVAIWLPASVESRHAAGAANVSGHPRVPEGNWRRAAASSSSAKASVDARTAALFPRADP